MAHILNTLKGVPFENIKKQLELDKEVHAEARKKNHSIPLPEQLFLEE